MRPAFFEPMEGLSGCFLATNNTAGPWSQQTQHAGPPTALMVRAIENLTGLPAPGLVSRVCVEILAPVAVGPVRVSAAIVRSGAKVALCEAELFAGDDQRPVMRMRAWVIRTLAEQLDVPRVGSEPAPGPGTPMDISEAWSTDGYLGLVEWMWVEGTFESPGPATVWTKLLADIVPNETPSTTQHTLAIADSASGISAVASPAALLFINTDLTVHLARPLVGDAIWMRAETVLDPLGVGLTTSTLGDAGGPAGRGAQSLFVEPR